MMNSSNHDTPKGPASAAVAAAVGPLKDEDHEAVVDNATLQQHKSIPSKKQRSNKDVEKISIQIVSAFYRPCEQKQQQGSGSGGGPSAEPLQSTISKLYTRNVTPFVRALLMAQKQQEAAAAAAAAENEMVVEDKEQQQQLETIISQKNQNCNDVISINAMAANGMKRSKICILDGMMQQSMNSIFGDPCPGTSKRLYISYSVIENANDNVQQQQQQQQQEDGKKFTKRSLLSMGAAATVAASAAAPPIHHVSFAEHEKVILNLMVKSKTCQSQEDDNEEDAHDNNSNSNKDVHDSIDGHTTAAFQLGKRPPPQVATVPSSTPRDNNNGPWRLHATSSEIILPLVMPYLQIKERVACRLVCRVWKNIIRDWGVATTIDVQENSTDAIYSCSANNNNNNINNSNHNNVNCSYNNNYYSRPFIRGILKHSYSALHTLFLSGLQDLNGPCDLHPSIPHLRKLACLDVSHCIQLGDDTLTLLSLHCSTTLQVLYVKALPLVTDVGMMAICQTCRELQVLDISHLHALTDQTGMAIGQHLHKLRALYMRDNYNITNASIDLITTTRTTARGASCGGGGSAAVMLETLTLWGCMRLKHLNFCPTDPTLPPATFGGGGGGSFNSTTTSSGAKLVSLNLWGCHSLTDDWASALSGMHNLKSLVVSECHRLTDTFVLALTQTVPQLHHLFLLYCKRLTDNAVDAIALNMPNLYSLDLSFCSRLSAGAIVRLLDMRWETLAELRLQSCNLQISNMDQDTGRLHSNSNAGRQILHSLRRHGGGDAGDGGCCLSVLDVRPSLAGTHDAVLADDDPFVLGMKALSFEQTVPCCFVRPARWNPQVEQVLSNQSFSKEH